MAPVKGLKNPNVKVTSVEDSQDSTADETPAKTSKNPSAKGKRTKGEKEGDESDLTSISYSKPKKKTSSKKPGKIIAVASDDSDFASDSDISYVEPPKKKSRLQKGLKKVSKRKLDETSTANEITDSAADGTVSAVLSVLDDRFRYGGSYIKSWKWFYF